jgi:hypothetical protein
MGRASSPRKLLKFEARKCHFLHSESKFARKFMLTILVFEIKERKNEKYNFKYNNLSLLSGRET